MMPLPSHTKRNAPRKRRLRFLAGCAGRLYIAALLVLFGSIAHAADFTREELRIPFAPAGPRGLEAVLVKPSGPQRYPLALISHGSPRDASERAAMNPDRLYAQAVTFARRGFAALLVMRRGYGTSGGGFAEGMGRCEAPDYLHSARTSAEDLRAAVAAMMMRNDVTTQGMIAVGQSAGGLATVAFTADAPPGLVAAINFAGGRGSLKPDEVCDAPRLIETFAALGKTSRVPMLWIYTENDHYFSPQLAKRFYDAFTSAGGKAEFVAAPAFGDDGHMLFFTGIARWTPAVDQFLRAHNIGLREILSEPALPDIAPPPQLSERHRGQFTSYLKGGQHKAFAIAPGGAFSWRQGRRSAAEAKEEALHGCAQHGTGCAIYSVDGALTPR